MFPGNKSVKTRQPSREDVARLQKTFARTSTRPSTHVHAWRTSVLVCCTALALVLVASGTPCQASPSAASSAGEETPVRKEFPVSRLHQLLKEQFQKRKADIWARMFQRSDPGHREEEGGGGGGRGAGRGGRGRQRRNAGEEKKLLSLDQEDRLGTFVGEVMSCKDILGLSLGMVRGGARQGQGYGVADMETARQVDKDTLFGIGSNSKAFGAASIAHLMVTLPPEKRFSFDTPLVKILKEEFQLPDPVRTQETTVMDVLSHRTGLASADLGIFSGYPQNFTTQDFCRRLQFLPEMVPFRSAWYYSNTMFVLVSRLCEVTAGKNWSEVLEEAIWKPLQMNNTFLTPQGLSQDNVALPYILRMRVHDMFVQQDFRLFDLHPLQAAGAIMSSAADMTRWLAHLLDALKRPQGVAMSVLRQIFTERTLLPSFLRHVADLVTVEPILPIGYGMGFMTSYYKRHLVYWHTGDLHGYNSILLLVPDLDTAVYVAVNGPSSPYTGKAVLHLAYFVLELLQGHQPWVNLTQVCPQLADSQSSSSSSSSSSPDPYDDYDYPGDDTLQLNADSQVLLRPIEDYLGVFGHGLLGDLKIIREEERNSLLRMELGRLLVADLIATDNANIFKLAPRVPLADTKEWEQEHTIVFKSSPAARAAAQNAAPAKQESTEKPDSAESESKNATKEQESLPELDQVQMRWELETYIFDRSVRFDSMFEEERTTEAEPELTTKASAVIGDQAGSACFVRPAQLAWLLVLCSVLVAQLY